MEAFWDAMPAAMKLLMAIFAGGTLHFLRNRALPIAEGLTGTATSMIAGWLLMLALSKAKALDWNEWWFLGGPLTFMANYFLGGMENMGTQIRDTPVKFIVETAVTIYTTVKEKFFNKKPE